MMNKSTPLKVTGFALCMLLTGCGFITGNVREGILVKEASSEDAGAEQTPEESPAPEHVTASPEPAVIYVDVCGAVRTPGVYVLPEGSRVFQAIESAGGLLPGAAVKYVNRAAVLTDSEQLYIPTAEEAGEDEAYVIPGQEALTDGTSGGMLNLNTATAEQLCTLTGIGEAKAKAIIRYREKNGPFSSTEELMNVEGIKEGTFANIKDDIYVK